MPKPAEHLLHGHSQLRSNPESRSVIIGRGRSPRTIDSNGFPVPMAPRTKRTKTGYDTKSVLFEEIACVASALGPIRPIQMQKMRINSGPPFLAPNPRWLPPPVFLPIRSDKRSYHVSAIRMICVGSGRLYNRTSHDCVTAQQRRWSRNQSVRTCFAEPAMRGMTGVRCREKLIYFDFLENMGFDLPTVF